MNITTWARGQWRSLRANKLIANASIYVTGNILQRAADFLLVPLWTYFLTPSDYGISGVLTAYTTVLLWTILLGTHGAVARLYFDYAKDPEKLKSFLTSVMLFDLGLGLLITVLLNIFGPSLWRLVGGDAIPFDPLVRIIIWTAYFRVWIQIPMTVYQTRQKAHSFMLAQWGNFGLSAISALVLVVGLRMGATGKMISFLIGAVVMGVVLVGLFARDWFTLRLRWEYVRKALRYGIPLVPHHLSTWAMTAMDRVILQRFVSLTELGVYNLGYSLGMAMQVLVVAINQAWMPYFYRMMDTEREPEKKVVRVVSLYIGLIGGVCLIGVLLASDFIVLVLPDSYAPAIPYVGPVLLGYLLLGYYYFFSGPLFYHKKTVFIPLLPVLAALVNTVLNLLFIPRYGAIASAWVTTVTYTFLLIPTYLLARRFHRFDYPLWRYALVTALIFAAVLLVGNRPVTGWSVLGLKAAMLVVYAVTAYGLLIAPALFSRAGNNKVQ